MSMWNCIFTLNRLIQRGVFNNASARSAIKRFLSERKRLQAVAINSIGVSPKIPRRMGFREGLYACNIFRFDFWIDDLCFFALDLLIIERSHFY